MLDITLLVFDRITALDALGPYEVLRRVPEARVRFAAPGLPTPVRDDGALVIQPHVAWEDVERTDVLLVPGGFGVRPLREDEAFLAHLRTLHETTRFTASVCTGALLLGAAGLLEGAPATTHWAYLDALAEYGATPREERVVEHGKILTGAGVSAGIDLALGLAARLADEATA
ncbi:MAG TPA: DJ-1/PfpI family protein, partial [Polyangiaceae bacterium LLY-WYZ-15_(1-7)]|nr:DJ-1/PfpI family protein [Polyangiaceae bacterium LLY-WYZ-15_(1-7)]